MDYRRLGCPLPWIDFLSDPLKISFAEAPIELELLVCSSDGLHLRIVRVEKYAYPIIALLGLTEYLSGTDSAQELFDMVFFGDLKHTQPTKR